MSWKNICVVASLVLALALASPALGQKPSRQQVNEWAALLRSPDPQKRASAATSLVYATEDESALKFLLDALQADKPEAGRVSVITAFGVKGDERASAQIISALGDPSETVRQAAKSALETIYAPQSETSKLLQRAMMDTKRVLQIRIQAINVLGDQRAWESIPSLISLLSDSEESVRTAARTALESITLRRFSTVGEWENWWSRNANMGREETLRELVALQSERIRELARINEALYIRLLTEKKDSDDPKLLIEALSVSDSIPVKKMAIAGLSKLKGEAVAKALVAALGDADGSVRQAAADALAAQPSPGQEAVAALIKALADPEASVRISCARALGKLKAKEAVEALCAMLPTSSPDVAVATASALGEIGSPAAIDALGQVVRLPSTPVQVCEAAAKALGRINDPRSVPILVSLLQSTQSSIRWTAAEALGGLRPPAGEAVRPLAKVALEDQNPQVREVAVSALSTIGTPAALETVTDALADTEKRVSDLALNSIMQKADADASAYAPVIDRLLSKARYDLADKVVARALAATGRSPNNAAAESLRSQMAAGLIVAKEWARARVYLEALRAQSPKEAKYTKDLVSTLFNLGEYEKAVTLLADARKSIPDLSGYTWAETVRALEQIAAQNQSEKVVALVDALEKETPDLGGADFAAKLQEMRSNAKNHQKQPEPPKASEKKQLS